MKAYFSRLSAGGSPVERVLRLPSQRFESDLEVAELILLRETHSNGEDLEVSIYVALVRTCPCRERR